ncbi:PAS domain S-box protein [Sinobaca sp. H24]|uniref:PAS domain S-box protein n=1 Tax=Sinobaca sp. H24 TaxID=2923376 RepID=UPI00207AC704|nr:PAS domain S-box protein [Sinobaca sp. H24]
MNRPINLQTFACTLQETTTIKEAAFLFKEHGAAELPVLNEQQRFIGLLHQNTLFDTVIQGISPEEPIRSWVELEASGLYVPSCEAGGRIACYEGAAFAGLVPLDPLIKENKRLQTMLAMAPLQVWITDREGAVLFTNDVEPPLFTQEEWSRVQTSEAARLSVHVSAADKTYTVEKQRSAEEDGLVFYYVMREETANSTGEERAELLEMIYEYLYDGIITVDKEGYVTMLSKEYGEFLGVNPEEMIGRHCTEVIENTRMHIVAKTGKPEIADFQKLKTGYMVATRIPIIKNGEITGALGKVLFKNITGVKGLQTRIQQMEKDWKHYKGEWQEQNMSTSSMIL